MKASCQGRFDSEIHDGNVDKSRQRRSRPFAVLTYWVYAPFANLKNDKATWVIPGGVVKQLTQLCGIKKLTFFSGDELIERPGFTPSSNLCQALHGFSKVDWQKVIIAG